MRKKNLTKRLDSLVFQLLGCASFVLFICMIFCPSCRNTNERQLEQEQMQMQQEEFYEPFDNPPKSKFDSVRDSQYLITEQSVEMQVIQ